MTTPLILIVEDHRSVRDLLRVVLESEGYRTLEATDGAEALQAARDRKPDLVVLDLMMPGVDGEWFIRQMLADKSLLATPVVVVSAKQDAFETLESLLGLDNIFPKPFEPEKLISRIEELIGPGQPLPTSTWKG
ncbi:MAG: response regulator [Actinomycetota bacterium]